jgi:hypothetical protein
LEPQAEPEQTPSEQTPSEQAAEPQPEPEPEVSDTVAAIAKNIAGYSNLGNVSEDQSLLFVSGTDYGIEGIENAQPFENTVWFTADDGEEKTYTESVVSSVMAYYSKLMDKLNNDDDAVMELVAEDSQLYGELSAISANSEVTHSIESLKIGEIRSDSSDFYVLVKVTEKISSLSEPEITTKLMRIWADADENVMKIMNVVDIQ